MSKNTDIAELLRSALNVSMEGENTASIGSSELTDAVETVDEPLIERVSMTEALDTYAAGTAVADTLSELANQADNTIASSGDNVQVAVATLESLKYSLHSILASHRIQYTAPAMESTASVEERLLAFSQTTRQMASSVRNNLCVSMEQAQETARERIHRLEDTAVRRATTLKQAINVIKNNKDKLIEHPVTIDHKSILTWLSKDNKPISESLQQAFEAEHATLSKIVQAANTALKAAQPLITVSSGKTISMPQMLTALKTLSSFSTLGLVRQFENTHLLYNTTLKTKTVRGSLGNDYLVLEETFGGETKDGSHPSLGMQVANAIRSLGFGVIGAAATALLAGPAVGIVVGGTAAIALAHSTNEKNSKPEQGKKTFTEVKPDEIISALTTLVKLVDLVRAGGNPGVAISENSRAVVDTINNLFSMVREYDDKKSADTLIKLANVTSGGKIDTLTEAKSQLIDQWYYLSGTIMNLSGIVTGLVADELSAATRLAEKLINVSTGETK
ncbi:hypothetical protein ACLPJK_26725 [Pseudomonas aeruginosa]|uniref:hypothetical protein n=1 Tax=Pseudomonas aeruginosa TaxID=287 RepID=UPI003D2E0B67